MAAILCPCVISLLEFKFHQPSQRQLNKGCDNNVHAHLIWTEGGLPLRRAVRRPRLRRVCWEQRRRKASRRSACFFKQNAVHNSGVSGMQGSEHMAHRVQLNACQSGWQAVSTSYSSHLGNVRGEQLSLLQQALVPAGKSSSISCNKEASAAQLLQDDSKRKRTNASLLWLHTTHTTTSRRTTQDHTTPRQNAFSATHQSHHLATRLSQNEHHCTAHQHTTNHPHHPSHSQRITQCDVQQQRAFVWPLNIQLLLLCIRKRHLCCCCSSVDTTWVSTHSLEDGYVEL